MLLDKVVTLARCCCEPAWQWQPDFLASVSLLQGQQRRSLQWGRFEGDGEARLMLVYEGFDPLTAPDIADNILYALDRVCCSRCSILFCCSFHNFSLFAA